MRFEDSLEGRLLLPCSACGNPGAGEVAQVVHGPQLLWYESTRCTRCGLMMEADGSDFPPPGLRFGLLYEYGAWMAVPPPGRLPRTLVDFLRPQHGGGLGALLAAVREAGWIFRGTATEASWVARRAPGIEVQAVVDGAALDMLAARPAWAWTAATGADHAFPGSPTTTRKHPGRLR